MKRLLPVVAALLFAAAGPAMAQETGPDSGWIVDLGAVGRVRPAHLGSDHYLTDVAPVVEATWNDRLVLSLDDGAKWVLGRIGPVEYGPIAEYRQSFNDDLPPGAFRMNDAVEIGGFSQVKTPVGIVEARLRHAVNGYDGWSGDLSFDTGGRVTPKLLIGGQLRLSWADSNFSQEYFGLKPHVSKHFGLPQFLDEDYITAGAEFDAAREITPHVRLVMALSADRMLGEMPSSPLFRTRDVYVASFGATYHWSTTDRRKSP
jgi:outer membrane scaffolding protein for murein synthesis (MipA/OmpV family)